MTSVWKRLQRVGKRASKFQFVASYHELTVEGTNKWYVAREIPAITSRFMDGTRCKQLFSEV